MMTWNDIPASAKMTAVTVSCVLGMMGYLTTYQTDAEAQAYQAQASEQTALFRIQLIENQISLYRYQLLSNSLTPEQREWILAEIRKLETEINCIRAGQC